MKRLTSIVILAFFVSAPICEIVATPSVSLRLRSANSPRLKMISRDGGSTGRALVQATPRPMSGRSRAARTWLPMD